MFKPLVLSVFCLIGVVVAAAPAASPKPANNSGLRDARSSDIEDVLRRKADLRAALQAQKSAVPQGAQVSGDQVLPARRLSDQDRANLRQQIRLQQP